MEYSILYSRSAAKELNALPKKNYFAVKAAIENLRNNPTPHGYKALKGELHGYYRIRRGDYRILYTIQHKEITISIIKIGNRKDIYD